MLKTLRNGSASLAAAGTLVLSEGAVAGIVTTVEPENIAYVRHIGVSRGGNTASAIRINIRDGNGLQFDGYIGDGGIAWPEVYNEHSRQYESCLILTGRLTITVINDGTVAATNIGVSVLIEIVPSLVNEV